MDIPSLFAAPPPGAMDFFGGLMKSLQEQYEKDVARLTKRITFWELRRTEAVVMLSIFGIPHALWRLVPAAADVWNPMAWWARGVQERYKFQRLPEAERERRLEEMRPTPVKVAMTAGLACVAPLMLLAMNAR